MIERQTLNVRPVPCASCGRDLPADEPAYLSPEHGRAHISENPDHQLVAWQKVGDPIYGIPRWRSNGEPTGVADPTPSPTASCTCSCGLTLVATTNGGAAHAFMKHVGSKKSALRRAEVSQVVHRWDSRDVEDRFACGRKVKRQMRWDIRKLTKQVLKEHRQSEPRARFCVPCLAEQK